jgi:hypothetical protein
MTEPIFAGSIVRVRTNDPDVAGSGFKNDAGALTDPTTVALRWHRHGEVDTVWTLAGGQVVKDSVGVYHADITTAEPGLHYFRWEGGGALVVTIEGTFSVESFFIAGSP